MKVTDFYVSQIVLIVTFYKKRNELKKKEGEHFAKSNKWLDYCKQHRGTFV